jgi:multiple sugar transport system substrate-binding protein
MKSTHQQPAPQAISAGGRRAKTVLAAGLAATTLAGVTACGSSKSTGAAAAPTAPASQATYTGTAVVNLNFWSWTLNAQAVVDKFNATHSNIHVNFTQITGGVAGYSKIFDAYKAGNGPDVFNCEYTQLPSFVAQGDVQDISAYVDSSLKTKLGSALPLTQLGGKYWAIPYDVEPQVFYYRTDLFKQYNLQVPTTWDEFAADAKTLQAANPKAHLINFPADDPSTFAALSWQAGAKWFSTSGDSWNVNLTDTATQKVAAYWQNLIATGGVTADQSSSPAVQSDLTNGDTLATINGPFEAAYLKSGYAGEAGKWAEAPLPTWTGQPGSGAVGGSSYPVGKATKNTAAALEFAEWMSTNADAVATRSTGGKSTALPADPDMVAVAEKAFDGGYFGGQDVYTVAKQAATTIVPGWSWAPSISTLWTSMQTPFGKLTGGGTIADSLTTGQTAFVAQLKSAGISVAGQ